MNDNKPIRILIADDHAMIREGLKQILELEGDIEIVGEASDGYECLNLINKLNPEIVLLDINMPNLDGIQVLNIMKQQQLTNKVIILTIHKEIDYLIKVLDMYLKIRIRQLYARQLQQFIWEKDMLNLHLHHCLIQALLSVI